MIEIIGSLVVLIVLTVLIIVFYPQLSNLSRPVFKYTAPIPTPTPTPPVLQPPIVPPPGCMLPPPPGTALYTPEPKPEISPGCTLPPTTTPTPPIVPPAASAAASAPPAATTAATTAASPATPVAPPAPKLTPEEEATLAAVAAATKGLTPAGIDSSKLAPNYPDNRPQLDNTGGISASYDVTSPDSTGKIPNPIKQTYEMTQARLKSLQKTNPEVFNISTNKFTYYDADALCHSMGAELATIEQVYDSYKNGGEWCNMGWTKGMMALYPTQKNTWEKLQNGPAEDRGKCGLPGLNGGTRDPNDKYGVNCYGSKPSTPYLTQMIYNSGAYMPKSPAEIERDKRAAEFKKQTGSLALMPFNYDYWAQNY
jgi:hypothetical protein